MKHDCGFGLTYEKYKKCNLKTDSVGLLIKHTVKVHKMKETPDLSVGLEEWAGSFKIKAKV